LGGIFGAKCTIFAPNFDDDEADDDKEEATKRRRTKKAQKRTQKRPTTRSENVDGEEDTEDRHRAEYYRIYVWPAPHEVARRRRARQARQVAYGHTNRP